MGNNQSMERDEITTNILEKFHNQLNNSCHSCWGKKMSDLSMYKHFFLNHMAIVEIKALYTIVSKKTWSTDCIYKHNPWYRIGPSICPCNDDPYYTPPFPQWWKSRISVWTIMMPCWLQASVTPASLVEPPGTTMYSTPLCQRQRQRM